MRWLEKAKELKPTLGDDWFEEQDDLFHARVASFQTKWMTEYEAKCLALKLYLRDYDLLKEVHCFECQHLKGSPFFSCAKSKPFSTNQEALHKCIGFIPTQYGESI